MVFPFPQFCNHFAIVTFALLWSKVVQPSSLLSFLPLSLIPSSSLRHLPLSETMALAIPLEVHTRSVLFFTIHSMLIPLLKAIYAGTHSTIGKRHRYILGHLKYCTARKFLLETRYLTLPTTNCHRTREQSPLLVLLALRSFESGYLPKPHHLRCRPKTVH